MENLIKSGGLLTEFSMAMRMCRVLKFMNRLKNTAAVISMVFITIHIVTRIFFSNAS